MEFFSYDQNILPNWAFGNYLIGLSWIRELSRTASISSLIHSALRHQPETPKNMWRVSAFRFLALGFLRSQARLSPSDRQEQPVARNLHPGSWRARQHRVGQWLSHCSQPRPSSQSYPTAPIPLGLSLLPCLLRV